MTVEEAMQEHMLDVLIKKYLEWLKEGKSSSCLPTSLKNSGVTYDRQTLSNN